MTTADYALNQAWRDPFASHAEPGQSYFERHAGLFLAGFFHLAAIWGLLQFDGVRQGLIDAAPIMVNFIEQPKVVEPPKPLPPTPKIQPQRQPEPAPVLVSKSTSAAAPTVAEQPKTLALPPIEASAQPLKVVPPNFTAAYLHNPPPLYPSASRRYREEGTVLLQVHVSENGAALKVDIHKSSGSPRLDQAAQEAVRSWRFTSAKQGETKVSAWVIVPITFNLEN